jgi:hypothetical protein
MLNRIVNLGDFLGGTRLLIERSSGSRVRFGNRSNRQSYSYALSECEVKGLNLGH